MTPGSKKYGTESIHYIDYVFHQELDKDSRMAWITIYIVIMLVILAIVIKMLYMS